MQSAQPARDMEVLGTLVALPVGLAAERFGTVRECAAVGPFVTFLVLPSCSLLGREDGDDAVRLATYFISQRRRVRLEQISHWNQPCLSSEDSGTAEEASSESRWRAAERTFCSIWR